MSLSTQCRRIVPGHEKCAGIGELDYEDFVPLMLEVSEAAQLCAENVRHDMCFLSNVLSTGVQPELRQSQEEAARIAALDFLLKDKSEDLVLQNVTAEFKNTDADCDGVISALEFSNTLKQLDLGLTKLEMKFIMLHIDPKLSGFIAFEAVIEDLWDLIVSLVSGSLLEGAGQLPQAMDLVLRKFVELDVDGAGLLPLETIHEALQTLPLSPQQANLKPSPNCTFYPGQHLSHRLPGILFCSLFTHSWQLIILHCCRLKPSLQMQQLRQGLSITRCSSV